jgi:hypothetical protein
MEKINELVSKLSEMQEGLKKAGKIAEGKWSQKIKDLKPSAFHESDNDERAETRDIAEAHSMANKEQAKAASTQIMADKNAAKRKEFNKPNKAIQNLSIQPSWTRKSDFMNDKDLDKSMNTSMSGSQNIASTAPIMMQSEVIKFDKNGQWSVDKAEAPPAPPAPPKPISDPKSKGKRPAELELSLNEDNSLEKAKIDMTKVPVRHITSYAAGGNAPKHGYELTHHSPDGITRTEIKSRKDVSAAIRNPKQSHTIHLKGLEPIHVSEETAHKALKDGHFNVDEHFANAKKLASSILEASDLIKAYLEE